MTTFQDANALLGDLSLDDLRILRHHLTDEEGRVSYWRRLFEARLDMIRRGDTVDTEDVRVILQDASDAPRRWQALGLHPADIDHYMPEARALWNRVVDLSDEGQRGEYAEMLAAMVHSLTRNRSALHNQIDTVTAELIARYRTNPALALTALPCRRRNA